MPYTTRGKCIYKKDTGKKVGCTKGSVKKYMAALHSNVKEDFMMKKFFDVSNILNENEGRAPITPEEKAKRSRMVKRMAALGMLAGAGVTAGELMLHPASRRLLVKAAKKPGTMEKIKGVAKQAWKPMALGIGADLAIEPMNTKIAQRMEDKYQQKKVAQSKPKVG